MQTDSTLTSSEQEIPVICRYQDQVADGTAIITQRSGAARRLRAFGVFLLWLLLAMAACLIPILHFILPPIFLLLGLIMATRAFRTTWQLQGGTAKCPACGETFEIFSGTTRWPVHDQCSHCRRAVNIKPQG